MPSIPKYSQVFPSKQKLTFEISVSQGLAKLMVLPFTYNNQPTLLIKLKRMRAPIG
jgi:hypothetical protein